MWWVYKKIFDKKTTRSGKATTSKYTTGLERPTGSRQDIYQHKARSNELELFQKKSPETILNPNTGTNVTYWSLDIFKWNFLNDAVKIKSLIEKYFHITPTT